MKFLKQGLCLALLGTGLSVAPATLASHATAAPSPADNGLAGKLHAQADGNVSIRDNAATGKASFVRATGAKADLLPGIAGDTAAKAASKADSFVDTYGALLGASSGELVRKSVASGTAGWTVTYTQVHDGVPVFGSAIKANIDTDGDLTAVNGFAAPTAGVSTKPGVSAATVEKRALAFVQQDPPSNPETGKAGDTSGIKASSDLVLYRTGFLRGDAGATVLAYAVEVSNGANIRDQVILDAKNGKLLNRYSMGNDALDRELYELSPETTPVWQEGDPLPGTLNPDQLNLVNSAGESYWLYENAFGRDSYDGAGATMKTVNNDPDIACPNANWNGQTTNYCDGVTSDDVVSHEWGHAYTEYTSGLIYQFQSGALNESYSDVWGETLDLINGREDEGETFATKREDGGCELTAPPGLDMEITAPAGVAGPCFGVAATGAKPFTTTAVTADVVVATDAADAAGPSTTDGCSPYTNAAAVAGNWAYVDRGTCTFAIKVAAAETAGATGIVIGNNNVDPPGGFTGDADLYGVMVTQADGDRFKSAGGPVSVSVTAEDITAREDSTRWLMGEKSTAFGGAIRDMWTPTCYGDPGKVSDVEYKCDPLSTDAGGVHSNSGVPNHAYALAVDGGAYNGVTITGMGLDKAAAIWWRNQTAYLTPSSNFTEAADGFEASCADLTGDPIQELTTAPDAAPVAADPITQADCVELTKVIDAVEMRSPVTKCNFQPLLAKNTPALCGPGFKTETVWKEDFTDGLAGWTPSFELFELGGPFGGIHEPWAASTSAPGGHAGGVAYGPAPAEGQCTGDGVTDFSSRDSIASPATALPAGTLQGLNLSFDHYVATEATYDGGNVKMSVNGGPYTVIPAAAYTFNKPGTLATLAQGNSNPLGGQQAFNGTDGGQSRGSWGTSQVDLAAAGAKPGDTVQFRFDIGRDGCGGVEGWYVDNIQVTYCKVATVSSVVKAKAKPKVIKDGRGFKAKVTVTTASGAAAGVVEIYKGKKLLGTGTLHANGKVTIKISKKKAKKLKIGKNKLTAKYLGSATANAGQDDFVIKVKRVKKNN